MTDPIRILYVDDYPLDRELVRDALEKEHGGFRVIEAASRQEFEARLTEGGYDLVLSDFNILGFEGLEVIDAVRAQDPHAPVVVVTGTGSEEVAVEAMRRDADDYVIKSPQHIRRLPHTIRAVMEKKRLQEKRERAEEQVRATLKEREVLLKEIHHRVKDNLQVISSLLNLQSRHAGNEQAIRMLQDSRDRIRSIALVHEKMYGSPDLARIDFAGYVRDMADHLILSHEAYARGITLEVEADVTLDLGLAVPCGLIVNELLSNALKHGFPSGGGDEGGGEIRISLSSDQDRFTLTVADNGVGFPPDLDFRHTKSLGLQLVVMLVEQLNGMIELERGKGVTFRIEFAEPGYEGWVGQKPGSFAPW